MKTPLDPRHQERRRITQALYAWGMQGKNVENKAVKKIVQNLKKIDKIISACAPAWPLEQINRVDLAILRLAVYELMVMKKEPVKVIIDEAIELAKEFGSDSSPAFVNGVLGASLTYQQ